MNDLHPFVKQHRATLLKAALAAHGRADPRHSGFQVGAAILTQDGQIFSGANWEVSTLEALGKTTHAEQTAIAAMIGAVGPKRILAIAIAGGQLDNLLPCPPCGSCREQLAVYMSSEAPVFLAAKGPTVLGVHGFSALLPATTGIYDPILHGVIKPPSSEMTEIFQKLSHLQTQAYVPYSKAPVAVAVRSDTGSIFYGVTREDAAYTGCSATQNALGAMVTTLGPKAQVLDVFYSSHPSNPNGIVMPSGPDRQSLREYTTHPDRMQIYSAVKEGVVQNTLEKLLPLSFGPDTLKG